MRVLWLRFRILLVTIALGYRRGCMYHHARLVSDHQNALRRIKGRLASIDCPRQALRVVVARKVAR